MSQGYVSDWQKKNASMASSLSSEYASITVSTQRLGEAEESSDGKVPFMDAKEKCLTRYASH